jgi:hypothetical protein
MIFAKIRSMYHIMGTSNGLDMNADFERKDLRCRVKLILEG